MAKIFVKCKDKTSSRWLGAQSISIVGSIPQQVNKTDEVARLIVNGVLVEVTASEYQRAHSKKKASKAEKLDMAIKLFNNAISEGNVDEATKQAKNAVTNGQKKADSDKFTKQIEALVTKLKTQEELEAREEKAKLLVEEGIEKDALRVDDAKFICLGDLRLGKETDDVIAWAAKSDENLAKIQEAIDATGDGNDPE